MIHSGQSANHIDFLPIFKTKASVAFPPFSPLGSVDRRCFFLSSPDLKLVLGRKCWSWHKVPQGPTVSDRRHKRNHGLSIKTLWIGLSGPISLPEVYGFRKPWQTPNSKGAANGGRFRKGKDNAACLSYPWTKPSLTFHLRSHPKLDTTLAPWQQSPRAYMEPQSKPVCDRPRFYLWQDRWQHFREARSHQVSGWQQGRKRRERHLTTELGA